MLRIFKLFIFFSIFGTAELASALGYEFQFEIDGHVLSSVNQLPYDKMNVSVVKHGSHANESTLSCNTITTAPEGFYRLTCTYRDPSDFGSCNISTCSYNLTKQFRVKFAHPDYNDEEPLPTLTEPLGYIQNIHFVGSRPKNPSTSIASASNSQSGCFLQTSDYCKRNLDQAVSPINPPAPTSASIVTFPNINHAALSTPITPNVLDVLSHFELELDNEGSFTVLPSTFIKYYSEDVSTSTVFKARIHTIHGGVSAYTQSITPAPTAISSQDPSGPTYQKFGEPNIWQRLYLWATDHSFDFLNPSNTSYFAFNYWGLGEKWIKKGPWNTAPNENIYITSDSKIYSWAGTSNQADDTLITEFLQIRDLVDHHDLFLNDPHFYFNPSSIPNFSIYDHHLDVVLRASPAQSEYQNAFGLNEKWFIVTHSLTGTLSRQWAYILPNGVVYTWNGSEYVFYYKLRPHRWDDLSSFTNSHEKFLGNWYSMQKGCGSGYCKNWSQGYEEKWLLGTTSDGQQSYYILPNGSIYRWNTPVPASQFDPANDTFIGRVSVDTYANPALYELTN